MLFRSPSQSDLHPLDVDEYVIEEYVGSWYIRKVLNSNKEQLSANLSTFEEFYTYFFDQKLIEAEHLAGILSICKQTKKFFRRHDEYFRMDPDSDTWDEEFAAWICDEQRDQTTSHKNKAYFRQNKKLQKAVEAQPFEQIALLTDFSTYLNYLQNKSGMKLTKANSWIPRSHLLQINHQMTFPEELSPYVNQYQSPRLHSFYHLAGTLGLFGVSQKSELETTDRIEGFQSLSKPDQFTLLFETFWNGMPWEFLEDPNDSGAAYRLHKVRGRIAHDFSICEPGREYFLRETGKGTGFENWRKVLVEDLYIDIKSALIANVMLESIIFPVLKEFGLLDFQYQENRKVYWVSHRWGIEKYTTSELGSLVFKAVSVKR